MKTDRLSVVELKQKLGDVLNRTEYQGTRTIIHRRDKEAAAIVPIEDLRLLERLVLEREDREDIAGADAACAESDERVPYSAFRARLGLTDGDGGRTSGV